MPIYAYKCSACGFAKDVLQKMSDAPLSECPACSASAFSKQLTAAGFQLKGSGWYVTDFRGGNSGAGADKPADDKPPAAADAADAKPTAAADASGKPAAEAGAVKAPAGAKAPAAASAPVAAKADASPTAIVGLARSLARLGRREESCRTFARLPEDAVSLRDETRQEFAECR